MADLKKIADAGDARVVLINEDAAASSSDIRVWLSSRNVAGILTLLDPKNIAASYFNVESEDNQLGLPHAFLIAPDRRLIADFNGLDQNLAADVESQTKKWREEAAKDPDGAVQKAPPHSVWLFFTSSSNGRIVPPAYSQSGLGGLSRRAAYINREKKELDPILVLDSGDNMPIENLSTGAWKASEKALTFVPYDAMVPGEEEFFMGGSFALKNIFVSSRPYLTANLAVCATEKLCTIPAKPYAILQKGDLKIGVIGVFYKGVMAFAPKEVKKRVKVLPLKASIAASLEAIRKNCDIVILLSHSGMDEDMKLAQAFPDIDLIVGGHSQDKTDPPVMVGKTAIVQPGSNGDYVGKALLIKTPQGIALRHYELVPLDSDIGGDPSVLSLTKGGGK